MTEVLYRCSVCKKDYETDGAKDACMESHGLIKVKREKGYDWLRKPAST